MKLGCVECFVLSDTVNECIIETENEALASKLYWSFSPEEFNRNDYIGAFDRSRFEFNRVQNEKRRVYYHLEFDDGTIIHTGERILKIPGMYNFRDMGGYPTHDGKRVKWGMLYRGDQLYNLEDEGKEYVTNLGIKTIVDFRTEKEIKEFPNYVATTVVKSVNFDPNAHIAAFAGSLQNNEFDNEKEKLKSIAKEALSRDANAGEKQMIAQQLNFVHSDDAKKAFKNTVRLLIDSENYPVFQHCKGGKDRTGFAAMMELVLLGVDESYILYDYLLTQKAREKKNKRYYQRYLELTGNKEYADFFYSLFDTKETYLLAAIEAIKKEYGTLLDYAKATYKISEEELVELRRIYLE